MNLDPATQRRICEGRVLELLAPQGEHGKDGKT